MYLNKRDADNLLKSHTEDLINSLKHKQDFLAKLGAGDDWSFVIKAQTLIEEALTNMLVSHIGEPRLTRHVRSLPLIGEPVSKLALGKDLDLVSKPQRRFIQTLANLRNQLAHQPEHTTFTFQSYFSSLSKERTSEWQRSIPWFAVDDLDKNVWFKLTLAQPRATLHVATFQLLAELLVDVLEKELLRNIDDLAKVTTTELLLKQPSDQAPQRLISNDGLA
jgi:hypothetical protein